jgi:hypothetical protein
MRCFLVALFATINPAVLSGYHDSESEILILGSAISPSLLPLTDNFASCQRENLENALKATAVRATSWIVSVPKGDPLNHAKYTKRDSG